MNTENEHASREAVLAAYLLAVVRRSRGLDNPRIFTIGKSARLAIDAGRMFPAARRTPTLASADGVLIEASGGVVIPAGVAAGREGHRRALPVALLIDGTAHGWFDCHLTADGRGARAAAPKRPSELSTRILVAMGARPPAQAARPRVAHPPADTPAEGPVAKVPRLTTTPSPKLDAQTVQAAIMASKPGPTAAAWVAAYVAAHGAGPLGQELAEAHGWTGSGDDQEVLDSVIRELVRAGWLHYTTEPRSLRPGPLHKG